MEGDVWMDTKTEIDAYDWKGNPIRLENVPAIKNKETGKIRVRPSEVAKAEIRMLAEKHKLEPRDVALLLTLFAKPGLFKKGEVHCKYHLNKMLFYQWKNMEKRYLGKAFPHDEFRAASKGPIPIHLWNDLRRLEQRKIVSLDHYIWGKDRGEASLVTKLTSDGLKLAEKLWNTVPPDLRETTLVTKEQIFPLNPKTIMKKVHREFPEYRKTYTELDRE